MKIIMQNPKVRPGPCVAARNRPSPPAALFWMVCALFFIVGGAPQSFGDDGSKSKDPKKSTMMTEKTPEKVEHLGNVVGSMSGIFIEGDKAQFMQRHRMVKDFSGGLEDFSFEQETKDLVTRIEGRALYDAHDYHLKLEMEKPNIGKFDIGYTQFRTWYDAAAGYFPQNGQWFSLYDAELALDRGVAWFEGELAAPDLPVLGFKYEHEFRQGTKDSLLWGDSNLTGGFGARKIVPSFRRIDEQKDIFEGTLKHTIDITEVKVALKYETTADSNKLYVQRNPSEARERVITTREIQSSSLFNVHGSTETWFSEKLLFSTAYSMSTLDTDIGGSFIYGGSYDPPFSSSWSGKQSNDSGFIDLDGGLRGKEVAAALNLMTIPWEHLTLTLGVRVGHQDVHGEDSYILTSSTAAGGVTSQSPQAGTLNNERLDVSESLEVRYTGIKNWAFYARGGWEEGDGAIGENLARVDLGTVSIHRDTDLTSLRQKYAVGANWYPLRRLNLGSQFYHKVSSTWYLNRNDRAASPTDSYPGFANFREMITEGANLRATWRILDNLTSVSRYDFQETTFDLQPGAASLIQIESGRSTRHIWGETLSWSPLKRMYVQAMANYAIDRTETPASAIIGNTQESRNDYYNLGLSTGYALNDKTDIQAQYSYYRADNYYDNSTISMPYGAGAEEHGITTTLTYRISENIVWSAKYGFFNNRDENYGGRTDYDAHLVYTSLGVAF